MYEFPIEFFEKKGNFITEKREFKNIQKNEKNLCFNNLTIDPNFHTMFEITHYYLITLLCRTV